MQAEALWQLIAFLLNATLFILIGLQLPAIVDGLHGIPAAEVLRDAAAVCAAVILTRFAYNFVVTALIRTLDRRASQRRAPRVVAASAIVGGWSGMRGAVSLAAALALPLTTDDGDPLPGRALILFMTFALILVTVVGEGLTLPWLIRKLGVVEDPAEEEAEELHARLAIASRRAGAHRRPRRRGLDARGDRQPRAPALRVPAPALQDPRGQARGPRAGPRRRDRGALAPLPAADARDLRGAARRARAACATSARSPARCCAGSSARSTWRSPGWRSERRVGSAPCSSRCAPTRSSRATWRSSWRSGATTSSRPAPRTATRSSAPGTTPEDGTFVWVVQHAAPDGWDAAERAYYDSPERQRSCRRTRPT